MVITVPTKRSSLHESLRRVRATRVTFSTWSLACAAHVQHIFNYLYLFARAVNYIVLFETNYAMCMPSRLRSGVEKKEAKIKVAGERGVWTSSIDVQAIRVCTIE